MNVGFRKRPGSAVAALEDKVPAPGENGLTLGEPSCGWFKVLYVSARSSILTLSVIRKYLKKDVLKLLVRGVRSVLRPPSPVRPLLGASTTYCAVFGSMDGRIDLVLDCGTVTGLGATTVDVTEPYWRVIKQGAILEKDIAEVLKGT